MWHGWPWYGLLRVSHPPCLFSQLPKEMEGEGDAHSAVGAESPATGFRGLLHDNVFDDELLDGEVFGVGVGLGVLQKTKDERDRLDGPST